MQGIFGGERFKVVSGDDWFHVLYSAVSGGEVKGVRFVSVEQVSLFLYVQYVGERIREEVGRGRVGSISSAVWCGPDLKRLVEGGGVMAHGLDRVVGRCYGQAVVQYVEEVSRELRVTVERSGRLASMVGGLLQCL